MPSLRTRSFSPSLAKYGRSLYARSSSHTSIGEKVVRFRFFLAGCSKWGDAWSGSLLQLLGELVLSEQGDNCGLESL